MEYYGCIIQMNKIKGDRMKDKTNWWYIIKNLSLSFVVAYIGAAVVYNLYKLIW